MMPSDEMVASTKFDYLMTNPARIVVSGDVAVVHYVFAWSGTINTDKGSDTFTQSGKNTEFFVKEDGKWLLIGDMTVIDDANDD
jgi:ketosteroid isomerase-like protein